MIGYISVPFTTLSRESMNSAIKYASKHIGHLYESNDMHWCFVSSIFSAYDLRDGSPIDKVYPYSRMLIQPADLFIVLRAPGYEFSEIVTQEIIYAHHLNKVITYHDII